MHKAIYAVTAAAIIAGAIVALPSWSASTVQEPDSERDQKLCPQKAWPYIQASCSVDSHSPSASARIVRVIPGDRAK
jgi:hypothetical protein